MLVADAWQGQGLGSLLTDVCLEIAVTWGVRRVRAEVPTDHPRMISMFKNRHFNFGEPDAGEVLVNKELQET